LDQAILLGQIETLLGLDYIDSYLQRINAVTTGDVADVCSRYLSADNRTVAFMLSDGCEDAEEEDEVEAD
jgi:predicted Zn-dependent peptidase